MSFWSLIGTKINDLECFKQSCRQNDVSYEEATNGQQMRNKPLHAILTDNKTGGIAYLVRDGGAFKLMVDNDTNYSAFSNRLGKNGGTLTRDYAENFIRKGIKYKGGMVRSREVQKDGSVILKIAAM